MASVRWPSTKDHRAFHEDPKPGDLAGQLGTSRFSSSKKFDHSTREVTPVRRPEFAQPLDDRFTLDPPYSRFRGRALLRLV